MISGQVSTPPPYKEDKLDWIKLLNQLIFLLFLVFVGYLVKVMTESGREETVSVFMEIRNRVYLVLIFLSVGLGFWIIIQNMRRWKEKRSTEQTLPVSTVTIAFVYTTFAYAVAQMFFNLGKMVGLF